MKRLILCVLLAVPAFGAIQAKVGSFTQGTTGITGVGFQPQIVLFFTSISTADGSVANMQVGFGAGISSSSRFAISDAALDASAAGSAYRVTHSNAVINIYNSTGAATGIADLVSMGADGFTLSWSVSGTSIINYVALAGFTNVALAAFSTPTSTGNADITTAGFQPDCVLTAYSTQSNGANNLFSFSMFTSGGSFALSINGNSAGSAVANRYQRTLAYTTLSSTSTTPITEGTFVSMLSNGFRINYNPAFGTALNGFYVALKGGSFAVGTTTQPTSNATVSVTGLGMTPALVMLMGTGIAASTSSAVHARFGIGAASGTAARFAVSGGRTNAVATSVASSNLDRSAVIKFVTEAGATPTVNAAADISAIASGGFTLNWTTTDTTARQVGYLVIGDASATTVRRRILP